MRALLCAVALSTAALECSAVPFAVQVGEARLGMDAPAGFSDTTFTGSPRLQQLAESLTSASNRVLLFALTDEDLRRFTVGDTPEAKRYLVAVTPKALEQQQLSLQAFQDFVLESLRGLGEAAKPGSSLRKVLDASPGKLLFLDELRRDPTVVSVLVGTRLLPPEGARDQKPKYGLTTTTLLLLRGKAVQLGVYGTFDEAPDAEWMRGITARWVEELQRLNR
ncbi:MAG: hypothetical protein JO035_16075 [Betaproteobacteria bacterium]|nr:hypothetical protein [Betaproteobacteria bacterium]